MPRNVLFVPFFLPPVTGGDFVALDHIAELNCLGFDARALYLGSDEEGIAKFTVPVVSPRQRKIYDGDIVVIGEVHKKFFAELRASRCVKVMHNQNPFLTFFGFDSVQEINAYPLTHIITPSIKSLHKLRAMGIAKPILHVPIFLPTYFAPASKRAQIAFFPGKRPQEASFIKGSFKSAHPELAHIPWVPLMNMTRRECAGVMAESALYAAFPLFESVGLMTLEALASGCHVVGYNAKDGDEYATAANGSWVADGDHVAFVQKLKEACALFLADGPNPAVAHGVEAARHYSFDNFASALKQAYTEIMGPNMDNFRK